MKVERWWRLVLAYRSVWDRGIAAALRLDLGANCEDDPEDVRQGNADYYTYDGQFVCSWYQWEPTRSWRQALWALGEWVRMMLRGGAA